MIGLNGRQVNENLLSVRVDRRKAHALLDPAVEAGLAFDLEGLVVDPDNLTESNLLFRLWSIFANLGASLEPPLAYDKDLTKEHLTPLRNILRRLARRVITSSGEGYLQQQEYLNALYVRGIAAAEKLIEPGPGLAAGPRKLPDQICFRPLEAWEPELIRAMAALGGRSVLVFTVPCVEMMEAFERVNRPFLAVGNRDLEVSLCQERFLHARLEDPLEFLRRAPAGAALTEYGMVLLGAPEFLRPVELSEAIHLAAAGMRPKAVLAVKVEKAGQEGAQETGFGPEESEPGFQRPYYPDFVARLMIEAGLEIVVEGPPMALGRVPAPKEPEAPAADEQVAGAGASEASEPAGKAEAAAGYQEIFEPEPGTERASSGAEAEPEASPEPEEEF